MSQMFSPAGDAVAVTLIACEPNVVSLKRFNDKNEYVALQLALPRKKQTKLETTAKPPTKPGEQKKLFAKRCEFKLPEELNNQAVFTVTQFAVGDTVKVCGISKGKGFQGVVKRHHFSGGPASHGHTDVLRSPGSIGCRYPQHVRKGKRMAGRMGADRVTIKNLQVVWIDAANNLLAVSGAIPGTKGSVVEIISC